MEARHFSLIKILSFFVKFAVNDFDSELDMSINLPLHDALSCWIDAAINEESDGISLPLSIRCVHSVPIWRPQNRETDPLSQHASRRKYYKFDDALYRR